MAMEIRPLLWEDCVPKPQRLLRAISRLAALSERELEDADLARLEAVITCIEGRPRLDGPELPRCDGHWGDPGTPSTGDFCRGSDTRSDASWASDVTQLEDTSAGLLTVAGEAAVMADAVKGSHPPRQQEPPEGREQRRAGSRKATEAVPLVEAAATMLQQRLPGEVPEPEPQEQRLPGEVPEPEPQEQRHPDAQEVPKEDAFQHGEASTFHSDAPQSDSTPEAPAVYVDVTVPEQVSEEGTVAVVYGGFHYEVPVPQGCSRGSTFRVALLHPPQ